MHTHFVQIGPFRKNNFISMHTPQVGWRLCTRLFQVEAAYSYCEWPIVECFEAPYKIVQFVGICKLACRCGPLHKAMPTSGFPVLRRARMGSTWGSFSLGMRNSLRGLNVCLMSDFDTLCLLSNKHVFNLSDLFGGSIRR